MIVNITCVNQIRDVKFTIVYMLHCQFHVFGVYVTAVETRDHESMKTGSLVKLSKSLRNGRTETIPKYYVDDWAYNTKKNHQKARSHQVISSCWDGFFQKNMAPSILRLARHVLMEVANVGHHDVLSRAEPTVTSSLTAVGSRASLRSERPLLQTKFCQDRPGSWDPEKLEGSCHGKTY